MAVPCLLKCSGYWADLGLVQWRAAAPALDYVCARGIGRAVARACDAAGADDSARAIAIASACGYAPALGEGNARAYANANVFLGAP